MTGFFLAFCLGGFFFFCSFTFKIKYNYYTPYTYIAPGEDVYMLFKIQTRIFLTCMNKSKNLMTGIALIMVMYSSVDWHSDCPHLIFYMHDHRHSSRLNVWGMWTADNEFEFAMEHLFTKFTDQIKFLKLYDFLKSNLPIWLIYFFIMLFTIIK